MAALIGGAALLVAAPIPALAAYLLEPGDAVELTVVGSADLNTKAMVDVDGLLHLPLLPALPAAGRPLADVETQVKVLLQRRSVLRRLSDGRQIPTVVDPDEVALSISSYRPVYVTGDVAKPGEQPFRPGLSVRQVVALAGGYDIMRFRMGNPFLESSDLRASYETLWVELARHQAHAVALSAMLSGGPIPDLAKTIKAPIAPSVLGDIARTEMEEAKTRVDDHERQRSYLLKAAADAQTEISSFVKPRQDAQQNELDEADVRQKLGALLEKGVVAQARVSDQQRTLLDSTQRFLNYAQRISELQASKDAKMRQVAHLDDERHATLLKDLQDANVDIADTQAKLASVAEKLLYTGAVRTQLLRGTASRPEVFIHHAAAIGSAGDLVADEDTVLTAGDTIEVSLRAQLKPDGATD